MSRLLQLLAAAVVVLALAGCGDEGLEVRAVFEDVVDLTNRASVRVADVGVGTVRAIELTDDNRALVTMRLTEEDVVLPADTRAELRKTNVLGERYVQLVPGDPDAGRYREGDVITDTTVVPELEELVGAGTDLLAAVTADRVAAALEAGAIGLGGRGETFNTLLDDFQQIVDAYEANSEDTVRLINGLDAFLADVGPEADLHGQAFDEVARATRVLREEDERLLDALADIRELSLTGTDIMRTHRQRFDNFFDRFENLTGEIVAREDDLDRLFFEIAKHNYNTIRGVKAEQGQIIADFIFCGVNDEPGDPVRSCAEEAPAARSDPVPREHRGSSEQHSQRPRPEREEAGGGVGNP